MQLHFTTHDKRISMTFDGSSETDLFDKISKFQEVFDNNQCGKCGNTNIKFVIRTAEYEKDGKTKTARYHELRCRKCGAKLEFGVHQDTGNTMYPKRKDKDGKYLPDSGWIKWDRESEQMV